MYDFDRDFNKQFKSVKRTAIGGMFLGIILNLVFWGGLIFFALWCLKHFGII